MNYIDTHAHLTDDKYGDEIDSVISRAKEAGVNRILMPDVGIEGRSEIIELCSRHSDFLHPMVGVHPTTINEAKDWRAEVDEVERLLAEAPKGRYCAVGEIGLDYYWSRDFIAEQRAAFIAQCEFALRYGLPVNIHTRDAWSDMCEILEQFKGSGVRGVMHAFCDTEESYSRILECGDFYFSIGGVVTFKKSQVAKVVPSMDLGRLLLETDSPYLTPSPHRGERNEPSMLQYICTKIGELKGVSPEVVARVTSENATRLFEL